MIQSVPVTWDETIVLPQSKIGQLAVYARRKGNVWFLAGLSSADELKELTINLPFLRKGKYRLTTIKDNPQLQADAVTEQSKLTGGQAFHVSLNRAGGFITRIEKETLK